MLAVLIFFQIMSYSAAHATEQSVDAILTDSILYLNGTHVDKYKCAGYNIGGNNYFRLRNLANAFKGTSSRFDVQWDEKNDTISILTGKDYDNSQDVYSYISGGTKKAIPMKSKLLIDGVLHNMTAYTINGNNYFKLRDLGELIPFEVEWKEVENKILLYSKIPQNSIRVTSSSMALPNALGSTFPRWEDEIKSYIYTDNTGNINTFRVGLKFAGITYNGPLATIGHDERLIVSTYDKDFELISTHDIPLELERFGAFYSGEKYNYIAFGQKNLEEDDDKEVIRIVRYDKNFNKIDSVNINSCYTIIPFEKAARMDENEKYFVLHMGRTRYKTSDGLNHQSQLTIIVDKNTMRVVNDLGPFQSNHVSHSFNQFVKFDGKEHVLVDHGDAYPRSVVLSKSSGSGYSKKDLFVIPGKIGANCTGVSVGGFEISGTHYLAAMNTIDHKLVTEYTSYEMKGLGIDQRDIILCALPRSASLQSAVNQKNLARYVGTNKIGSIPHLVKISDEKLMVLWQEFNIDEKTNQLKYVFIDGSGNPISQTFSLANYALSECKPVVYNNYVVWFTDYPGYSIIYTIPLINDEDGFLL